MAKKLKYCENCGNEVYGKTTRKYCNDGCKQEAYRKRHNLETPKFLNDLKEKKTINVDSTKNQVTGFNKNGYLINDNSTKSLKSVLLHQRDYYVNLLKDAENNVFPLATVGLGALGVSVGKTGVEKLFLAALGTWIGSNIDDKRQNDEINRLEAIKANARRQIAEIDKQLKEVAQNDELAKMLMKLGTLSKPNTEGVQVLQNQDNKEDLKEILPLAQFKKLKFDNINFDGTEYGSLFGNPEPNFLMAVHGTAGNGKSTYALKLAEYLANNHGRVLYNSSEEGFRASLQNKLTNLNSQYFHISNCRTYEELDKLLSKNPARFVVIDSINDMKITPQQLGELRTKHTKKGFIIILQATKNGGYKGGSEFAHDADIQVKIENREPILEKSRYL